MEQRSNDATCSMMDAKTEPSLEDALNMEQRSSDATAMDAKTCRKLEECVLGMDQGQTM